MKKNIFLLIAISLLFSCKKEQENQTETNKKSEEAITQKTYEGEGTFDKNGNVNYKAILPKEVDGKIEVVTQIQVNEKTLFIQIKTPRNEDLYNKPDQDKRIVPINKIDPTKFKDTIYVHLWHDDKTISSVKDAEEIIDKKCGNGFQPERCGNGVLTLN